MRHEKLAVSESNSSRADTKPMKLKNHKQTTASDAEPGNKPRAYYKRLFRRFVSLTIVCSLLPLLVVGWVINIHYTGFARERLIASFHKEVDNHRRIIELFLKEQRAKLQLIARSHSLSDLTSQSNLSRIFDLMNREDWSITDLGVIDSHGRHLAYVGPYNLIDKNYSEALWFQKVMENDIYISDMFMGFRKEPHFIIAVTSTRNGEDQEKWILRATVDTEAFRSLVENVQIGKTGEVYLLNKEGIYQTASRFGSKIMDKADFPATGIHEGIQTKIVEPETPEGQTAPRQVIGLAWLEEPRWLLVVKQDFSEAFNDVNQANWAMLLFLHVSAASILLVSVLVSRHMISVIKKRDVEAENLNRQLTQTSKLASIGQLSAGVAHEINNPLAIILTERQLLLDAYKNEPNLPEGFRDQLLDSLGQIDIQIQRCKRITTNLLRFSRRTESVIETVDLNRFVKEVVELMEREAQASGIKFFMDLDEKLPPLMSDPSQLQQVFLNLLTNAIDAHDGKSYGSVTITTSVNGEGPAETPGIWLKIADTGCGISPENLDRIFDPFFTTKAVGKGTGLGLSICFSIVRRLGGELFVESKPHRGTEFRIFLPQRPPAELLQQMNEAPKLRPRT
ncbi:MAG: two-component sensor histidine kinase [Desulfobacterales bacterium]|nr:two-component sensor histidine kinase [Desulfobacterales bacterium]